MNTMSGSGTEDVAQHAIISNSLADHGTENDLDAHVKHGQTNISDHFKDKPLSLLAPTMSSCHRDSILEKDALQDDAWEQSGSCQSVEETGKEGTAPISTKTKDCRRKRTSTKGHSRRQTSPDRKEGGHAQIYPYQTTEINTQLTHNKTSDNPGNLPASPQPNTNTHQRSLDSPLSDLKSSLERELEMQKTKTEQAKEIQQWLSKDTVGEAVGANSELDVHMNSHIHTLPRMLAQTSTGFGVEPDDRLQAVRAHTHTYLEREALHTYQERDESDLNLGTDEAPTNIENINTPTDVTSNGVYAGATPETLDEHIKMNLHTKNNGNTTPQLHNRKEPGPGRQPNLKFERKRSKKNRTEPAHVRDGPGATQCFV